MLTASQLLYRAAGEPPLETIPATGACFLCGGAVTRGAPARFPATFLDYDKARAPSSTVLCAACLFSLQERSPVLQARVGKDKPQCMRNYSHLVLHGQWLPFSKAQKRALYAALCQGPELAVIAVSGQKHLIFRAQPGRWQVEEQTLRPDLPRLQRLLAGMQPLYAGGFSKAEIESGRYLPRRILQFGLEPWQALEADLAPARGSALFELAVYLLQKDEEEDRGSSEASGPGHPTGLGAVARDTGGIQAPLCSRDLGTVPESPARRGHDDRESRPVLQRRLL